MAIPRYFVCAESYSIDRRTNRLSVFNFIEQISAATNPDHLPKGGRRQSQLSLVAISSWLATGRDVDDAIEYEHQFLVAAPDGEGEVVLEESTPNFRFTGASHRMLFDIGTMIPPEQSGILRFISRIRKVGTESWTSQEYPIGYTFTSSDATTDSESPPEKIDAEAN